MAKKRQGQRLQLCNCWSWNTKARRKRQAVRRPEVKTLEKVTINDTVKVKDMVREWVSPLMPTLKFEGPNACSSDPVYHLSLHVTREVVS